jgi:hypothetical protein
MQATVVDLRYRMNDVLKALERNEDVDILYRGKKKAVLTARVSHSGRKVTEHPFFNMCPSGGGVEAEMDGLRGGRHRGL